MKPLIALSALVAAVAFGGAVQSGAEAAGQAECRTYALTPDDIVADQLELYPVVAEPDVPIAVLDRDAMPASFTVTHCGQPYLLWERPDGPVFIPRLKVDQAAIGGATIACTCPAERSSEGQTAGAPALGVRMCPLEECS